MAVARRQIKSWRQLCEYAAEQMASAHFTDWPLYPDDDPDEIGADSGGTEHKVYANIMRHGVLTVDSQEGVCDPMSSLPSDHPYIDFKNYIAASEKQRSYVDALVPTDIGKQIIKAFLENGHEQQYYYLFVTDDDGLETSVPEDRFNVTSITWRDRSGQETEELLTNTNVWHTREALEEAVANLVEWIRPQDQQSFNRDLRQQRIGYLTLVDQDYCSGRESAGRLLLNLLDTLQASSQHVRDPKTGRCILVGGPTWRQILSRFGDEVNLYQPC